MKEVRGMTNSRVKKAIDETIGNEPLMNEVFVQKVIDGKKKRKKQVPFFQPVLVVMLMLLIGAVLYFTPQEKNQAVEIEAQYLSEDFERLIGQYYGTIKQQDEKTLLDIAITDPDEAFFRYSAFDLTGPIHVLKSIEADEKITVFIKLSKQDGSELIDTLVINKTTKKLEVDALQTMNYYVEDVELPKELVLDYKEAPLASVMENETLALEDATIQKLNGYKLYQIPTQEGMWRVFEAPNGQQLDLGKTDSAHLMHFQDGGEGRFYFIDSETLEAIIVYYNKDNAYQTISGKLRYPGVTTYKTDFHELPVFTLGGAEPKMVTIEQGKLLYANAFEKTELVNAPEFYSAEAVGPHLLVIYSEDNHQLSSYYQLTERNVLMNERLIGMLEAKPEHLQDMILQNRYNDRIMYIFADDTLHYRSDTRLYRERPTAENQKPDSGELVEKTYTNLEIEAKNNQYFITAEDGFSWTLTRTAPRVLQDEKGIEYTAPIVFEDLHSPNANLLEGEIQSLMIQEAQGLDIKSNQLQGGLEKINALFTKASANTDIVDMVDAQWHVEVDYVNGQKEKLLLWLGEEGQTSSMMKTDRFYTQHTLYTIPDELAQQFRDLIQASE